MTATAISPISKRKKQQILHVQRALFYNLYEHHRKKIRFATLFGGRKHRDKFNFFANPNLGAVPKGSSPIFAILRELTEINSKKKKKKNNNKKNNAFRSRPSLSSLLRHPIWKWRFHFGFTANSYDQMRKSIRISCTNCLHYKIIANLQGIGFTLDFQPGFRIQNL